MSQYEPLRQPRTEFDKRPTPPPQPDFFMPAMPPLGLIHALETRWQEYRRRRRFRQRFLHLLAYDDHMLEDMGHSRDDILWASRLPLKEDAEQALEQRRAKRKAKQRR
ncbi:hypothetical protein HOP62_10760 [Halomonas sp. MCCC 1A17488]|uniref:DUF1127 domain-containing protein n=1 Tax=Billgrantia sulfidoxydans TaxID=2733484 RepID=A0ABX7W044_9GAMM|nr:MULTISPECIES: hypothetical protein [Halomonas]MCE8016550.1 hypothetical protein [Halomonas sp. MCCC 1A17488]MCG3239883.1 hypothetical protein [Halomonas sp. MCCC 1A17488]QPP50222.1 hypothetical protein I4484_03615 [Halomonas sp. SS10-MC5]QTP53843.1 hypothetical protein HNO51_03585 [Halomonas sulfidoxydans]